jgi:DHA3 family macrolide efflux protein-like MFS transporter
MKENMENSLTHWKKNISIFLISQAISIFGSSIVQYAIIWYITLTTNSGMMTTISILFAFLPQLLISIFAGVWADKHSKKKIIMLADTLIAISTLICAIIMALGIQSIWILFVVLGIRSFGAGVQMPTVNAFIPEIVPTEKLMRVNGINTTIQSIVLVISPAVSAFLLATVDIGNILYVDIITAIIGVGIVSFVKYKHKKNEHLEIQGYLLPIKQGLKYVIGHKFVRNFFVFYAIIMFLIGPTSFLTPLMVGRTFGTEEWRLALNEIIFFIGSLAGGGLIATWGGFKNKIKTLIFGTILNGVFCTLLGLSTWNFIFYLVIMGLTGLVMQIVQTPSITILQETVQEEMQGRIFSLVQIIQSFIMPFSMVLYGPLADKISIEILLVIAGIAIVITGMLCNYNKAFKEFKTNIQKQEI